MITSLNTYSGGRWLTVTNPGTTYISNSGAGAGQMRYNTGTQQIEIWNGTYWQAMMHGPAMVDIGSDAREVLEWAYTKMKDEKRIEELAKAHPGIADLKEKLDIMLTLVTKEDKVS